jgi:hypothetical protein
VEEIRENHSEQRQVGTCGELREGRSSTSGIVMNEDWVREEIWTREPTPEMVKRLIEWFSDERN